MKTSFYTEAELSDLGLRRYGTNVMISRKCSIYGAESVTIGDHVRIDDFCILSGQITIGNYVHISAFSALYGGGGITIGDYCGLSPRCSLISASDDFTGEFMVSPMVPYELTKVHRAPIVMEDFSQLGGHSVLMPGVRAGQGAVTGACALALRNLEPWTINIGIPCKVAAQRKKNILELVRRIPNSKM